MPAAHIGRADVSVRCSHLKADFRSQHIWFLDLLPSICPIDAGYEVLRILPRPADVQSLHELHLVAAGRPACKSSFEVDRPEGADAASVAEFEERHRTQGRYSPPGRAQVIGI